MNINLIKDSLVNHSIKLYFYINNLALTMQLASWSFPNFGRMNGVICRHKNVWIGTGRVQSCRPSRIAFFSAFCWWWWWWCIFKFPFEVFQNYKCRWVLLCVKIVLENIPSNIRLIKPSPKNSPAIKRKVWWSLKNDLNSLSLHSKKPKKTQSNIKISPKLIKTKVETEKLFPSRANYYYKKVWKSLVT